MRKERGGGRAVILGEAGGMTGAAVTPKQGQVLVTNTGLVLDSTTAVKVVLEPFRPQYPSMEWEQNVRV